MCAGVTTCNALLHSGAMPGDLVAVLGMIETFPLERAGEAYARMMSGRAEFRVVLTM
jgi:D-arabinose 1-dehydrogenase-like Zn-dependent alcohol dehydrogenase